MQPDLVFLITGVFFIAVLYSSVGHAGASGYIAVMSLLSMAPSVIKPTALALNILVASVATVQFAGAGHFNWRLFWPFALPAVPAAFLGGYLSLPTSSFKLLLGGVLVFSALHFLFTARSDRPVEPPPLALALLAGGLIGLLSGLTGTGGGIFLTPLLLVMGWALPKAAAGVSALFILVNSSAGLLGNVASTQQLPASLWLLLPVAAGGGLLGSYMGSRRIPGQMIKRLLSAVLLIAGGKLIFAP
ncbi:MAG: sulfite exporter TauE/SafE family protein [Rhodanobacteraceae bacterium]|nr:sulfite exporter TauE/SafE family protein [Rhodanobacteraceae bacterium]